MQKCEKRLPHIFPSRCALECPHKHVGNLLISVIPGVSTLVWNHIKTLERSNHDIRHLDSLNTSHNESDFTKSEIEVDVANADADLRQHCIHRANRWCNLRTTSTDEAISRLASEMQEQKLQSMQLNFIVSTPINTSPAPATVWNYKLSY